MDLIERVLELSGLWASARGRSLARLSTIVANDGSILAKLAAGKTCTVSTLQRFLAYLSDGASWPGGHVPPAALAILSSSLVSVADVDTAQAELDASGKCQRVSTSAEAA